MPELPEVEVVRRDLEKVFKDHPVIDDLKFNRGDLRDPIPQNKLKKLIGEKVFSINRRAKYLIFWTEKGGLLSHLGMTGTWRQSCAEDVRKHDHVIILLSNGTRLVYNDPRRFGSVDFIQRPIEVHKKIKGLGPEPLSEEFNAPEFLKALSRKIVPIKLALMDQKVVVGVGNIYANEALFMSKLGPQTPSNKVSLKKAQILVNQVKSILESSIEKGGSSISDFLHTSGEKGYFQEGFQVYNREGLSCVSCGDKIKKIVLGGRSTFFCKSCQK